MKALWQKLLTWLGLKSSAQLSALSTVKEDDKRINVYLTGEGGIAEYTNPVSNRETLGLKSAIISYAGDVTAEVSLSVETIMGTTGVLAASDGTTAAAHYYFSEINTNLMPSEKVILSSTDTGVFEATISFER